MFNTFNPLLSLRISRSFADRQNNIPFNPLLSLRVFIHLLKCFDFSSTFNPLLSLREDLNQINVKKFLPFNPLLSLSFLKNFGIRQEFGFFQSSSEFKSTRVDEDLLMCNFQSSSEFKVKLYLILPHSTQYPFNPLLSLRTYWKVIYGISHISFQSSSEFKTLHEEGDIVYNNFLSILF